jgi:type I restriction enzyme S subunit
LAYWLWANKELLENKATGTTFKEISKSKLRELSIPLPPLPEQRRIVSKIDELFSDLDVGVSSLKKAKAELARFRQSVLSHAFSGKLTEDWRQKHGNELEPTSALLERIRAERRKNPKTKYKETPPAGSSDLPELPEGWKWTNVGEIAESMKNGIYKPREFYNDDGVACLRMYNIEEGKIIWKNIKRMNLTKEEVEEYGLEPGDILVNRVNSRELVGKAAPIPLGLEKCVYESKNIRLRLQKEYAETKYVSYWFQIYSQKYFNRNAQQTVGMASINQEQISAMPIPLSSLQEQQLIVSEIDRRFSIIDSMEKTIDQSRIEANRLRQSILKRAFEGKLVPQDPTDEPANILLERIKKEKT